MWKFPQSKYLQERSRLIRELDGFSLIPFSRRIAQKEQQLRQLQLEMVVDRLSSSDYKSIETRPIFIHTTQRGLTCVATSLANGLRYMGENSLNDDDKVHDFVETMLRSTSTPVRAPLEERMLEDAQSYLSSTRGRELLKNKYSLNLTESLIEVVGAITSGNPVLGIHSGHCILAYHIERKGDAKNPNNYHVCIADSLTGKTYSITLSEFQKKYLASPLYDVRDRTQAPKRSSMAPSRITILSSTTHDFSSSDGILGYLANVERSERKGIGVRTAYLKREGRIVVL